MYKILETELKNLSKEIPYIHYGGCCVFALGLYKVLTDLGYKPSILVTSTTPEKIRAYQRGELDRVHGESQIDIFHIIIELNGLFIDNNGIYGKVTDILHLEHGNYSQVYIGLGTLQSWNTNFKHWNNRFYRGSIPDMYESLNNIYKKLEVSNKCVSLSYN